MLITSSILTVACVIALLITLPLLREAREDQAWQRQHGGNQMTQQIAANNVRREVVRIVKLLLFTCAAVVSLCTTPTTTTRATWAIVAINVCLVAVVAFLVEGAFRGRWERRTIYTIAAEIAFNQRRRRTDLGHVEVIAEQIDKVTEGQA